MRRRRTLAAIAALCLAACSLVFPFDGYGPGNPGPDANEQPDATPEAAPDVFRPGCPLLHAPDRPQADDPGGKDNDIVVALSSFVIGLGSIPTPSLDQDGLCTCPDDPPCKSKEKFCDRDGGVDNGFDDLALRIGAFGAPIQQDRVQQSLDNGSMTILIAIHRYNGLPNDTSVDVGVFTSVGTARDDAGNNAVPKKDGTDVWGVDPASVATSTPPFVPKSIATAAWVTGGVLVAHLDLTIELGDKEPLPVELHEVTLTARIVNDGTLWRLEDGILAGRWPASAFLTSLAGIHDPADPTRYLCGDSSTYAVYKPQACDALDITSSSSKDSKGLVCDAISLGAGFAAVQAQLGDLAAPRIHVAGCGDGYTDDCTKP
jgi:hypothetical protein